MKFWQTIPFAAAAMVLQAQAQPAAPISLPSPDPSVPLYRVTVVQNSAKAINYGKLGSSTKIDFKGTALMANATGMAKVKIKDGGAQIKAEFKDLPPASSFGGQFLTYVLWGISTEGRAANLGELVLNKHGKGELKAVEPLQSFGLVVTAEPYFAVSQPSDVVVLENAVRQDDLGKVELIDAKFDLLVRGQYTLNLAAGSMIMDDKTPFDVYQARNAVRIAQAAGAPTYAPVVYGKAMTFLKQSENDADGKKTRIMEAREAVQSSEDARLIAVKRQAANQLAMDQKQAQDQVNAANVAAAQASAARTAALQQAALAGAGEHAALAQVREAKYESAGLRAELLAQFNTILETRATARGLIVNMNGVLFQNGKATLLPPAREKLAKIAGILATHKGLVLEADGFTDSTGSVAYNLRLSGQRAENTMTYLVGEGVASQSITSKGFGVENPIASNATSAGRQENRRVELIVSGEGLGAPATAN